MKTIERIDFPVIITRDGNAAARHERVDIVFTHGAPAYVRAQEPFAIYPWEVVRQINRTSDEVGAWLDTGGKVDDPDLTERLRASVAAIADERNGAKQEAHTWRAEVERLKASNAEHRVALRDALGLTYDNHDHAGLCAEVKRIRAEWDHLSRYNSPEKLARLELRSQHDRDMLAKALGVDARDVDHGDLCARVKSMQADLASVTEQRDVLKRQIEGLRAETRGSALPQPKHVEPGGPIWVRVVDTSSKHFGLVGRLEGIEMDSEDGEMWVVDLGGIVDVRWRANVFAVIGTGRQGVPEEAKSEMRKPAKPDGTVLFPTLEQKAAAFRENNPPDTEHQQAQNRDKWRATCLANGAKDCTVYFGPGDDVTIVVELVHGVHLDNVTRALGVEHGLRLTDYKIRTVRPSFKHPADNGQP